MYRTLLATESPLTADELRGDLIEAGIDVVAESVDAESIATLVVRHAADLVIAASSSPSPLLFEAARMLGTLAPCPFVLFTSDADIEKIDRASPAGVHAYVVDGYAKHRLLSIVQVARARFRHEQVLKEEFVGLSQRFEERKLVDRAKGMLMRSRGITEDQAFEMLRSLAMRSRQRLGVVAQSVSDRSRAGEAVNRAGQLRMLSQRIVLCYARCLDDHQAAQARQIIGDCVERVEANLGILRKAISTPGYAERVERVATSWQPVRTLCEQTPDPDRLAALDACAETMLEDAEALTDFLENSGLVASLHVINVAGRQRMLGQRIAKLCFMLALEPSGDRLAQLVAQLRDLAATFQARLDDLQGMPLTSKPIRSLLQNVLFDWQRLQGTLDRIGDAAALSDVGGASERLLEASERLTDQYEQAMQMLIGDRMGRLR